MQVLRLLHNIIVLVIYKLFSVILYIEENSQKSFIELLMEQQ